MNIIYQYLNVIETPQFNKHIIVQNRLVTKGDNLLVNSRNFNYIVALYLKSDSRTLNL